MSLTKPIINPLLHFIDIKTPFRGFFVDIGSVEKPSACRWSWKKESEPRTIWTLVFNKKVVEESTNKDKKLPLLMVHGLCASAGLWAMNIDDLAQSSRTIYAIDLLGN
jgi:pimeloyl-ACP methyl ester carboxylesterase